MHWAGYSLPRVLQRQLFSSRQRVFSRYVCLRLVASWALLLTAAQSPAQSLQYLYLAANEGTASGGHVALQLDDEVFHYQYQDGLIRLTRDASEDFDFDYRYLQNRNIQVADMALSSEQFSQLQTRLKTRYWQEQQVFKHWQTLQQTQILLRHFLHQAETPTNHPASAPIPLPAAGLFYQPADFAGGPAKSDTAPVCQTHLAAERSLSELRAQLQQRFGNDVLSQRSQAIRQGLQTLTLNETAQGYGFLQRYEDGINNLLALQVIASAKPLQADVCHHLSASDWPLSATTRQTLQDYRQQLVQAALKLWQSKRPDWGQALMLVLARLQVVQHSLDSGQWTFLDDFSATANSIVPAQYENQAELLQALEARNEANWRKLWLSLSTNASLSELTYTDLERAANRYLAWQHSLSKPRLPYQGQQTLPLKTLDLPLLIIPALSVNQLQQGLQAIDQQEQILSTQLQQQYAYDLLQRNCVTELFNDLQQTLNPDSQLTTAQAFAAIPFLAFERLAAADTLQNRRTKLSLRQQKLAQAYAQDFAPWIFFREANVLSAEFYQYHADDSLFVFFTDDGVMLRPLFGAINTLGGLTQTLLGLWTWPSDDGARLHNGSRGLLMSLPELVFINIRKGSYKFALRETED